MEELTEVITAAEFHPTQCNVFMYSSSKSNIKLADMREAALCDRHAKSELLGRDNSVSHYVSRLTDYIS
jgi:serine/threonine-protein phosphatase 2A regulatory subunit B